MTLSVRDLACARGGREVFTNLGITSGPGELVEVRGSNGSGKSSLLRVLCGLLPAARGEVRWQGRALTAGDFAYAGHAHQLSADLSVLENLRFALRMAGRAVDDGACVRALESFGLARPNDAVRRLSQGQRQRVALARVLLSARTLWLLDEPCSSLDAEARRLYDLQLEKHLAHGGLAVVATHRAQQGVKVLDMDAHAPRRA